LDFDDDVALGGSAIALSYDNAILHPLDSTIVGRRKFSPAIAQAMYQSAVSTGYGSRKKAWLSTASTTVPHYGMKMVTQAVTVAVNVYPKLRVFCTMRVGFRRSR